uniref:Uncharacterized protein n=1 Tax=Avena sativa TaxID=4498 RepID=A0ACD5ZBN1_AVESA
MSIPHQCPSSPAAAAAPPLEDNDLLSEILLRLPPQPSSLPRASAVCNRWRGLVADPGFSRRFSRHHRRNPPPLIGFFGQGFRTIAFQPTMGHPNSIPPDLFSMPSDAPFRYRLLGCRHGLVLLSDLNMKQVRVWDPVTGVQHGLAVPPGFRTVEFRIVGTVLRVFGDHFQVLLAHSVKQQQHTQALACIYSSETGLWSDLISTLLASEDSTSSNHSMYFTRMPAVLVGDSLYWTLTGISHVILEFDLGSRSLAVIHLPVEFALCKPWDFTVMPAEGGGLGLIFKSDLTAQLWKMNTNCDGVASWMLGRTIEVGKLLSLNSEEERNFLIRGVAEYNNVVFLSTVKGLFMLQLESLEFKTFSIPSMVDCYHSFETVYAAGI